MNYLDFNCSINVEKNPLNLNINDYLDLALRNNLKRRFLFISKNLGKHIPVSPNKVDELGLLLSRAYKEKFKNYESEKQLVIGFAETATCLSHSFFNYLETSEFFIHTTRENINSFEKIEFKEEHSHATEQILYVDNLVKVNDINTIILVDDEITTSKTCINMIEKLREKYSVEKYVIVSMLNWIDKKRQEEINEISRSFNIDIEYVYLFGGNFTFEFDENQAIEDKIQITEDVENDIKINYISLDFEEYLTLKRYIKYTGRFGITRDEQEKLKKIISREAIKLNSIKTYNKVLAIGIEEFMYIPMMLSKELNGDVYYHSITRSPIIAMNKDSYPIKKKYKMKSFYNDNINYLYNVNIHNCEECFLFLEVCKDEQRIKDLIKLLKHTGIKIVNVVMC